MVDKERLVELAERCEAATGPDTHLDGLITLETGAIGAFTASLDAAMTIYVRVPERVPSNPRLAAAEALRRRADIEHV